MSPAERLRIHGPVQSMDIGTLHSDDKAGCKLCWVVAVFGVAGVVAMVLL